MICVVRQSDDWYVAEPIAWASLCAWDRTCLGQRSTWTPHDTLQRSVCSADFIYIIMPSFGLEMYFCINAPKHMYPGQALHLWNLLFYFWSSYEALSYKIHLSKLCSNHCPMEMLLMAACSTAAGRVHSSGSKSTDVIQTVLKSQYWQWQPCSCLLSGIHLAGAHFAPACLARIIVSCDVLDSFLGKARSVAPSSPGRAPMPLVRWERQKWGASEFLQRIYTISTRLRESVCLLSPNTNLSPQNARWWQQILASLCNVESHSGCWRGFIVQMSYELGTISVAKMLSLKITFATCVAPLKMQENDKEKGQIKYK